MALSEIVDLYDRSAASFHRWWLPVIEPTTLHLLDLIEPLVVGRPALIVDVGAGTGPIGRAAVARWAKVEVVGVDPSEGTLAMGKAAADATLDPSARRRLTWVVGVAERLPVETATADGVVSSFTLQYLPRRIVGLREGRRVLRPGGMIAVVTWLVNDWSFRPWVELGEVVDELAIARPPTPEVGGPFRSLPSAAALVRRAGFRDVHATEDVIEYRWQREALVRCTLEEEARPLVDSLDGPTRDRLERLWTERLSRLGEDDLVYRDKVAFVTGRA
jgi:ubiquinone/menaquinone biosynthesis C-methylase UbiE